PEMLCRHRCKPARISVLEYFFTQEAGWSGSAETGCLNTPAVHLAARKLAAYQTRKSGLLFPRAHFCVPPALRRQISDGELPTTSNPSAAKRALMPGSLSADASASCQRAITLFGVPFGAATPIHRYASKLGIPCSATVGRSGYIALRLSPAWPNAFTL